MSAEPSAISFSGGRSSAAMLKHLLQRHEWKLPDNWYVCFANTGLEHPATYDFVRDCENHWKVKIHWLELEIGDKRPIYRAKEVDYDTCSRNGEPFSALIKRRQYVPNPAHRICTEELKVKTIDRFMKSKGYKPTEYEKYLGIRADEPDRISKMRLREQKDDTVIRMPLAEMKMTKAKVLEQWARSDWDLTLRPDQSHLGNCMLCFMKGVYLRVNVIKDIPNVADWWLQQEEEIGATFNKEYSTKDLIKMTEIPDPIAEMDGGSCGFCGD